MKNVLQKLIVALAMITTAQAALATQSQCFISVPSDSAKPSNFDKNIYTNKFDGGKNVALLVKKDYSQVVEVSFEAGSDWAQKVQDFDGGYGIFLSNDLGSSLFSIADAKIDAKGLGTTIGPFYAVSASGAKVSVGDFVFHTSVSSGFAISCLIIQ